MFVKFNFRFLILAIAIITASTVPVWAADLGKTFEWRFHSADVNALASYNLTIQGHAKCECPPSPNDFGPINKSGEWYLNQGTLGPQISGEAKVPHAKATAAASVRADPAVLIGGTDFYKVTGDINFPTTAVAKKGCSKPIQNMEAWGAASASVTLRNKGNTSTTTRKGGTITEKPNNWDPKGATTATGKAKWWVSDPISMELYEVETGLSYTEELLSLEANGLSTGGETSMNWNETGITLSSTIDGQVLIEGRSESAWLVNPIGQFGAQIIDGLFTATGVWAGLDWQLTYDDSTVTAFLSAEEFSPTFELNYLIPDSLLHDEYTYDTILSIGDSSYSYAEDEDVPEPATIALLTLGGLAMLRKRK